MMIVFHRLFQMHYCALLPHNVKSLCSSLGQCFYVEFELLLSTNRGIFRQSKDGLIGRSTLPIGVNVSCVSLHVSPVMNYSFPRVYCAIISRILVYSAGQAILWLWCGLLMLKIVLTTWFKSGFCFSTQYDIWNQPWAQCHFINVCFCVWKSTH